MATKRENSENAKTVNNRIRQSRRGEGYEACEWSNADPGLLQQAIDIITSLGFAVQFGLTRDQQTFVIRIVGDGEPFNEYVRPTEDIDVYLQGLISDYEAAK